MNGTKITIRGDAVRGTLTIRQDESVEDRWIVESRNFVPLIVEAPDFVQAVAAAAAGLVSMKRTNEFREKQRLRHALAHQTREANGNAISNFGRGKRKTKQAKPQTQTDINIPDLANAS